MSKTDYQSMDNDMLLQLFQLYSSHPLVDASSPADSDHCQTTKHMHSYCLLIVITTVFITTLFVILTALDIHCYQVEDDLIEGEQVAYKPANDNKTMVTTDVLSHVCKWLILSSAIVLGVFLCAFIWIVVWPYWILEYV
jgi:hypothetical protein